MKPQIIQERERERERDLTLKAKGYIMTESFVKGWR